MSALPRLGTQNLLSESVLITGPAPQVRKQAGEAEPLRTATRMQPLWSWGALTVGTKGSRKGTVARVGVVTASTAVTVSTVALSRATSGSTVDIWVLLARVGTLLDYGPRGQEYPAPRRSKR